MNLGIFFRNKIHGIRFKRLKEAQRL